MSAFALQALDEVDLSGCVNRHGFSLWMASGFLDDAIVLDRVHHADLLLLPLLPRFNLPSFAVAMRGFLQALRQLCNERGLLLIHDQVQAGLNIPDKVFSPQHRDSVLSH